MTATAEPRQTVEHDRDAARTRHACPRCGAPLADDQEWCLECGGARTLIHPPRDWRVPVAIIGLVVLLVLAAFVLVLVKLSSDANRARRALDRDGPDGEPSRGVAPG